MGVWWLCIPLLKIYNNSLCIIYGTIPEFLRGHFSSFIDLIPGAILSHLVNLYGAVPRAYGKGILNKLKAFSELLTFQACLF